MIRIKFSILVSRCGAGGRSSSPDSGLSLSSSSLPSTTSLEADQDVSDAGKLLSSTRINEDSRDLSDLSFSLQNSSLSATLSAFRREEDRLSTSDPHPPTLNESGPPKIRKAAPKPPQRRDSLRSTRKNSIARNLEERFAGKFRPVSSFPPPPEFTNCPKTYPTKELFGVAETEKTSETLNVAGGGEEEVPRIHSRTSQSSTGGGAAFFSRIFSLKPPPVVNRRAR